MEGKKLEGVARRGLSFMLGWLEEWGGRGQYVIKKKREIPE